MPTCGLLDATRCRLMNTPRRRTTYVLLLLITIPLGLAWRMAPLGLSPFSFKYGGSVLWAVALYWFIAACLPKLRSGALAHSSMFITDGSCSVILLCPTRANPLLPGLGGWVNRRHSLR